jgi:hypothetical protein
VIKFVSDLPVVSSTSITDCHDITEAWTTFHFTFDFISVIFAADVKITYDDYRSTMIATADSKTIVTVNPGLLCQYVS